jgi:hypothetical protein
VTQGQDLAAIAREDVDVALEAFNRRSEAQGLRAWSRAEVVPGGESRLYCATAGEQFVLDDHDRRLPVIWSSAPVDRSPHRVSSKRRRELQCRSC